MNFQRGRPNAVFLMNRQEKALYSDRIEDDGKILIYEGHDVRKEPGLSPKSVDQPLRNPDGTLTDNGKFYELAKAAVAGETPRVVNVYEKLATSIWVFSGSFELLDAWVEDGNGRKVCKFKLRILPYGPRAPYRIDEDPRLIPGEVRAAVWKRDQGRCVACGATDNLHFDHILPYSRGGTSLLQENIQLLCARHNLEKGARIT